MDSFRVQSLRRRPRIKTGPPARGGGGPRGARPPWAARGPEVRASLQAAVEALARASGDPDAPP
eukprot:2041536-Pyramimonas_sp.AAC.1